MIRQDEAIGRASVANRTGGTPRPPGRARRLVLYLLLAITIVLVVDAVVGEKGLMAMLQARRQFDEVTRALERARADNIELRETARRLREDPAAIEALARKDLGLIRPGEKVFIVRDAAPRR
ncbi:MAG: septum formation initiator family protein [Acidobacteria bacterium]|nr:septum formation initiator family protein [Acidobacteriota bacterium]